MAGTDRLRGSTNVCDLSRRRRKSKEMDEKRRSEYTPSKNYTGGPHGLGDPDDLSLRKLELQVLIPKKIRERSRKEKCQEEVKAFGDCCLDNGLSMVIKCRKENTKLQECLGKWFENPEFVEECKREYLAERSEYRRTGIKRNSRAQPLGTNRIQSTM